jgi:hypothetical protein
MQGKIGFEMSKLTVRSDTLRHNDLKELKQTIANGGIKPLPEDDSDDYGGYGDEDDDCD